MFEIPRRWRRNEASCVRTGKNHEGDTDLLPFGARHLVSLDEGVTEEEGEFLDLALEELEDDDNEVGEVTEVADQPPEVVLRVPELLPAPTEVLPELLELRPEAQGGLSTGTVGLLGTTSLRPLLSSRR